MITSITEESQFGNCADIIRKSFKTVADEFGLTRENCPSHPSFMTNRNLLALAHKGLDFFGLFIDDRQVGFIATERAADGLFYFEKLAVLPDYRHCGYGMSLLRFAITHVKKNKGKKQARRSI